MLVALRTTEPKSSRQGGALDRVEQFEPAQAATDRQTRRRGCSGSPNKEGAGR